MNQKEVDMSKLLSPGDVAEIVNVAPSTARTWMADGKVPGSFRLGATYAVRESDLERALESGSVGERVWANGQEYPFLTSRQAQAELEQAGVRRVHVTVLSWLRDGIIPGQKVGKAWAVPKQEFRRMLADGFEPPKRGRRPDAG